MVGVLREACTSGRIAAAAALAALVPAGPGRGQEVPRGLTVAPVSVEMAPGQTAAVLNVRNDTGREADFEVRTFAWGQPGGVDQLTPTDALVASPPRARVSVGGGQVVRIVLREPARGQEAAYRILIDQAPPSQAGQGGLTLRLSIPVFAEPAGRAQSRVDWSLQSDGGAHYLVAVNSGDRHAAFRDMVLSSAGGPPIALETNVSPYVLAGATRRWRIVSKDFTPSREQLRLTARADSGPVDQPVSPSDAGA